MRTLKDITGNRSFEYEQNLRQEAIKHLKNLMSKRKGKSNFFMLGMMGIQPNDHTMAWIIDFFNIKEKDLK